MNNTYKYFTDMLLAYVAHNDTIAICNYKLFKDSLGGLSLTEVTIDCLIMKVKDHVLRDKWDVLRGDTDAQKVKNLLVDVKEKMYGSKNMSKSK